MHLFLQDVECYSDYDDGQQNEHPGEEEVAGDEEVENPAQADPAIQLHTGSEHEVKTTNTRIPRVPYQEAQIRTKRGMRSEIISGFRDVLSNYCHGDESSMQKLAADITESGKFGKEFGICQRKAQDPDSVFLSSLANEYQVCKDKEKNSAIREHGAKWKQKILIGNTLKDSRNFASEGARNRVAEAANIGRIRVYGDERRRLLSIVANDFPYSM